MCAHDDYPGDYRADLDRPMRPAAAVPEAQDGREAVRCRQLWLAFGCEANPDDFKATVRDRLWDRMAEWAANGERENRKAYDNGRAAGYQAARDDLASAAVREGERERAVKFYAAVKNAYDLQCTPLDRKSFGKDKFGQGAYCAHRWWWTVLGGVLRDFDDLAAPSLAAPEGTEQ